LSSSGFRAAAGARNATHNVGEFSGFVFRDIASEHLSLAIAKARPFLEIRHGVEELTGRCDLSVGGA
jgi:hypothetical protein